MILTNSSAAEVGTSDVKAILSSTSLFRQFMCYMAITLSQAISGTVGVIKNGVGGLTFSGACAYTGPTQINGGQIVISGTVASTLNGVISGTGYLTKTGTGTLALGGNNTYSGGTVFAPSSTAGSITYSNANAFGTGLFTLQGVGIITTAGGITLPNNFQLNSGSQLQFRTSGAPNTGVSGNIAGNGGIWKGNNGTLTLSGNLTYTGATTRQAGNLVAFKTTGASTATATFGVGLSVSFNVAPPSGVTSFRFFQGTTTNSYASVTLVGVPVGTTAIFTSATSTLSVTVP
jgi:autotransporter-associated beta strand protein